MPTISFPPVSIHAKRRQASLPASYKPLFPPEQDRLTPGNASKNGKKLLAWIEAISVSAGALILRRRRPFPKAFAKGGYGAIINKQDKIVLRGPKTGGPVTIGGSPNTALIAKNAQIDPRHAEFWIDDQGVQAVRDLGSGNVNVFRNGQRIDCSDSRFFVPIRPGDLIELMGKEGPRYRVSTHRKLYPVGGASEVVINQAALGEMKHQALIYPDYGNLVYPGLLRDGYRFGINLGKTKEDALRSGFINPDGSFKFPKEVRINRNTGEEQPVLFIVDRHGDLCVSVEARTQLDDVRKYFAQDEILEAYRQGKPLESLVLEKSSGYPLSIIPHADGTKQLLQTGGHSVLANGGGTDLVGARLIGELQLDDAGFVVEVNNASGSYNMRGGYGKPKELHADGVFDSLFLNHPDFIKINREGLEEVARLLECISGKPVHTKVSVP